MDDPHIVTPGHAPTPFTAEQIRRGCPEGRTIRLRVESAGQEPFERFNRFVECDETGATLQQWQAGDEPVGHRVTWRQLQAHASFPAEATTIEPEVLQTPLGALECLRYSVRDGDDEDVFWFATSLPGMPVRYQTQSGLNTVTMTG